MANKEAFLNRLAEKMGRPRIHHVKKPKWHRHPWDPLYKDFSQYDLVQEFEESLQKLGGHVIRVPSYDVLPATINIWLNEVRAKNIVSWNHDSKPGAILQETLKSLDEANTTHSPSFEELRFWNEKDDPEELISFTERADVGFTVAEHGLAETGTVVLYNRGDRGRLVSLLPTISATVLSASSIIPRLTQLLPHLNKNVEEYSCINLITGPSRSADIEMDLSIGVHGPGQIVVFLVESFDFA